MALITPDDANIIYSPFNWDVTNTRAKTINSGAYFRAKITGGATALTLNFDVSGNVSPFSQVSYRVDDGPWASSVVAAMIALTIPTTNEWTTHVVEVVVKSTSEVIVRWATQQTAVLFTGITATGGTPITAALNRRQYNVLFFGDSITEGIRTLKGAPAVDTDRNDARWSWAYMAGDDVGAEVGIVGFGGSGIISGGSGGVPAFINVYPTLWGGGPARSWSTPAPDVIVINHGQNDGGNDITVLMTLALTTMQSITPATTSIIVMSPFSQAHSTQVAAAVVAANTAGRVAFVDTTGWFTAADSYDGVHPYGYMNVKIAKLAAIQIRAALALRGKRAYYSNGAAVPLNRILA